jgi:transcription-repair coupling factor (superfamily II helicase)
MSLVGLRDISILNTSPIGRKKVITKSFAFDWNLIIEKIQFEIKRGGQVYFVHNEIKSIQSFTQKLQLLIPDARIVVAHGQMNPESLEKNTREFFEHKFDILLCTTIIQNGIDVPNVNTIIINKAHKLGLSQLYQLRGRVGRSPKQAYCYLVYPKQQDYFEKAQQEEITHHDISSVAMDRIATILDNQELGSGFNIASKDLELRGSGSILGYQQAGYIESVGLNLYMQILKQEIDCLKTTFTIALYYYR